MEKITTIGLIFITLTLLGFYLAYLYGKKTKKFKWSEYFSIVFLPFLAVLAFAYFVDIKILSLFVISSFAGFFLEYIVGLTYYKTLNKRLWVYNRLSLHGHSSLLAIPLWGITGVFFWFLSKMIGL